MIFTECVKCDNGLILGYEAGDPGTGGYSIVTCEQCGQKNAIHLVCFDGETMSFEDFEEKFIKTGKAHKNNA